MDLIGAAMEEREAMARAITLAWRGWGRVGGNPLVGALVLRDGRPIAEGWHAQFGAPHAEAVALKHAGAAARGSTLVVTLEPCRHQGKTPPCADAILRAGIRRVVFGAPDVDPTARGGGELLSESGVEVVPAVMAGAAQAQNAHFFHRHSGCVRPFVAVKLAVSLDGRIADETRRSRWITGEEARDWVHWLRAGFDAIGVALGTVLADDPQLTARGSVRPLRPPLRVVFDARAELPPHVRLARTARRRRTVVLAAPDAPSSRLQRLRDLGLEVGTAPDPDASLRQLARHGVSSLLIEGGGVLAGRLVAAGLVNRLFIITAPVILGADGVPAFGSLAGVRLEDALRWRVVGRKVLGHDNLTVLDRP